MMKTPSLFSAKLCLPLATLLLVGHVIGAESSPASWASRIGVKRGWCVVLGDAQAELALGLARQTELTLYLQLPDAKAVAQARQKADAAGFYGTRIYVEQGPPNQLYLADNLADAVIDARAERAIPMAETTEALRVARPQGKILLGNSTLTKPFPPGVDDWSHPYHLPDNNPVSRDQVARGPYLTQFLADPRYAPLPQVAVASAGRVFKAFGHIAFKKREEPWLNTLAAFNGYNGTLLWKHAIAPAIMVHRNTLIATPDRVYFGDDKSCKVFAAATGELVEEITPPMEVAGGTFWKWMAIQDGVLYALIGAQEERDPIIKQGRQAHGWPWNPLSPGFNKKKLEWGFGRNLVAIDLKTKRVLWSHREQTPIDSRALCLSHGRIYGYHAEDFLVCLEAATGKAVWRKTRLADPELFSELGPPLPRQDWRTNWRTTAYLKATEKALYFAGPTIGKLLAVSAADGHILWQYPYNNYQIIITDDALYGVGGQIDKDPARVFDPLTGKVVQEIPFGRRACTRVTGSVDALFCRASGGSSRLDLASRHPQLVSPMRPNCQDGVTVANGLLYWWPSVCDCNLTLYGITCLGPAKDFQFDQPANEAQRLRPKTGKAKSVADIPQQAEDWPTFRADNRATVTTPVRIARRVHRLWATSPASPVRPTAPTAVGSLVFLAGRDGVVRALQAATGDEAWKAYTGGAVHYPPTLWQGRAYVGSGDGWVYAFAAKSGELLWRFRAAPIERRIPVYGALESTWPVASGVLVEDGVAYVAAGIVNYDGTHVYALDAQTGRIRWQNNTSGHLDPEAHTGVSVQGHMVLIDNKLYLAGGNAVSPAIYDARTGKCLNEPGQLRRKVNNNVIGSFNPRGSELYTFDHQVMVAGKPLYAHPEYPVYDDLVLRKTLLATSGDRAVAWVNNQKLLGFDAHQPNLTPRVLASWGKPRIKDLRARWEAACQDSVGLAVTANAVVAARAAELVAFDLENGRPLWTQALPARPVPWGLCVDRNGRVLVTLVNGQTLCFSDAQMARP